MNKQTTIIKLSDITKYYGATKAVDSVSFEIKRGEIFSLLGENGAGKSTIIKLILGLSKLNKGDLGKIFLFGINTQDAGRFLKVRSRIGYVPEEKVLIEELTGEEYIDFIMRLYCSGSSEESERKDYLFELFGLSKRKNSLVKYYSNGMKKKLLLIGALIYSPEILIIDEPFAALDPESIYILKKVFVELAKRGCTILLSSHNLKIVENISSQVLILAHGKTLYCGSKKLLFQKCRTKNLEDSYIKLMSGSDAIQKVKNNINRLPYSIEGI